MSGELTYWNLEDEDQRLLVIEKDFRNLLKECGRLNSLLEEKEVENRSRTKGLLRDMLEVLDAFARVFKNIEEKGKDIDQQTKRWVNSFKAIQRKMEGILRDAGVSPIEAPEGRVIPSCHAIEETREVEGLEDDIILEELKKGYIWHDEVLRTSSVITVKNNRRDKDG